MKKLFFLASVAMVAIASTFVSCEDEDELSQPDNVLEAKVAIAYDCSSDLLEFADVKFTVTDFNGKKNEVVVTKSGTTELEYSTTKQDGEVKANLSVQPKKNFTPVDGKSYNLTITCVASKEITAKDGKTSQYIFDNQILPTSTVSEGLTLSKNDELKQAKEKFTINNNATYTLKDGRFTK